MVEIGKIKIAIAGVGNCASSLVQGLEYYKNVNNNDGLVPGLMHNVLGGHKIGDIRVVAAFDVNSEKVGKDLSEAIFAKPNCTIKFSDVPKTGIRVLKAPVMDGIGKYLQDDVPVDPKQKPVNVADVLKESGADMLINYLPVGSEEAVRWYAEQCLRAGCGFINCMPVFIASNSEWAKKFEQKNLPVVGDDIKSQVGATIVHRTLTRLFADRGVTIDRTYQLNVGGNTDFKNMLERERLISKKISKTQSVQSQMPEQLRSENIHIGPSDYIPWLKDNKLAFIRIEGRKFGNIPINLELRLSVEDSPNSAGVVIDAIRCCKLALDRGTGGALTSASSYFMKSPPHQFPDSVARNLVDEFISGKIER